MSAYNWIDIRRQCPACGESAWISCQTHFCSDYDGDDSGRFHDRVFKLGDKMPWWNSEHPRHNEWSQSNLIDEDTVISPTECCYSECKNCESELYTVILFNSCIPEVVLAIGKVENWPAEYYQ